MLGVGCLTQGSVQVRQGLYQLSYFLTPPQLQPQFLSNPALVPSLACVFNLQQARLSQCWGQAKSQGDLKMQNLGSNPDST